MDQDNEDLFLGKQALDRKLISSTQLKEALTEQARTRTPSGSQHRRLGDVLVSLGMLSTESFEALQTETVVAFSGDARGRDTALGRVLLGRGLITHRQLDECLELQATGRSGTPVLPLSELLIRMGFATAEQVSQALAIQDRAILTCVNCGRRCSASGSDPSQRSACPSCGAELGAAEPAARAAPDPAAPKRILGKYTILREIGRGGMGVVYEAMDATLNRKVALKMLVIKPETRSSKDPKEEDRFLREARLSAQLPPHPNVVGVYEAGVLEQSRYLAMEFVDGVSLLEWCADPSNPLPRKVAALRDVARGVQHAHEHGVIHRDLKPENILIDHQGQPRITDFGLAKVADRNPSDGLTAQGLVVGSPHYMSPEQVRGQRVDARSDVYSLGVILYEMFAGRHPYEGSTPTEIMLKALKAKMPSPSSIIRSRVNPVLHRSLEHICAKAIARNSHDRYPSAQALADDLTRWLNGEDVEADLPVRLLRRRRLTLGVGIVAAILVSVATFLILSASSIEGQLVRAASLIRQGNDPAAAEIYGKILLRQSDHKEALSGLEEIRRRRLTGRVLEAQRLLKEGRNAAAYDQFSLILIESPEEPRALEGRETARRRMLLEFGAEPSASGSRKP